MCFQRNVYRSSYITATQLILASVQTLMCVKKPAPFAFYLKSSFVSSRNKLFYSVLRLEPQLLYLDCSPLSVWYVCWVLLASLNDAGHISEYLLSVQQSSTHL